MLVSKDVTYTSLINLLWIKVGLNHTTIASLYVYNSYKAVSTTGSLVSVDLCITSPWESASDVTVTAAVSAGDAAVLSSDGTMGSTELFYSVGGECHCEFSEMANCA